MARRRKRRGKKRAETFHAAEVCFPATTRRGSTRTRVVECMPAKEADDFEPHCLNDVCTCGVTYRDFRSPWTFFEAAEMLGARGGVKYRPSRTRIVRMRGKLKRGEWLRHQQACAAGESDDDPAFWETVQNEEFEDDFAGLKGRRRMAKKKRKKKKKKTSWSKLAPSKITERRKMPKSCFLDRKGLKYPFCPKGTRSKQKVSCQGLEAAYKRARQQGKRKLAAKARRLQRRHGCSF